MHKIMVIGAVKSTAQIINSLRKHQLNVVGILGHEPLDTNQISGWYDLKKLAAELNIEYQGFKKINNTEHLKWADKIKPDIIFAVGFSQLMGDDWFKVAQLGIIGFHPTFLPAGRGRAPLAWLILNEKEGAATFFLMGKGADDGAIFVQQKFTVEENDDASTVENKIILSIKKALDNWLPKLKNGTWDPTPQDELKASWYGKRSSEDGLINWNDSAIKIDRLIKASTRPHPGAFTFVQNEKIIIWQSRIESKLKIQGVIGKILLINEINELLIQTGSGLIWVSDIKPTENINIQFRIGQKLGYYSEIEIFKIWKEIERLKNNE